MNHEHAEHIENIIIWVVFGVMFTLWLFASYKMARKMIDWASR